MAEAGKRGSGGFRTSPGTRFGKLEQVFDDVWWVWGTTRVGPGLSFPRNMWVIREGADLVVIHGVMLPEEEQKKVEALGPVKHIVRLGAFHGMDDPKYVARYSPRVWAPPGVDHQPGVKTDVELVPGGPTPIEGGSVFSFDRSRTPEVALLMPRHGGVLLTCDSVQNWETTDGCSFLAGLMSRAMGFRGRACIGPGWRKQSEPKDKEGFGPAFRELLRLEFRHVLGGHGGPMKETGKADLEKSVAKLYG
jgi:hypothetical protein